MVKQAIERDIEKKEKDMIKNRIYLVFATMKTGFATDELAASKDSLILTKDMLPSWMEFHVLYFFKFDEFNDDSEFTKKIHVRFIQQRNYRFANT